MNPFILNNPTTIHFGKGKVEGVGDLARRIGRNVLLVYGQGSVVRSGLLDNIKNQCKKADCQIFKLAGVTPNPDIDLVRSGASICKENDVDLVLAVGAGSAIDTAKAIAAAARCDVDPWRFFDRTISVIDPLPIATVLTLAATGSEMNGNTVISNRESGEKRPLYHPGLYPRFSILDPELTFSVPSDQTAFGSVDILSHVYEQYFHNVSNTPIQDGFCETIMRTVIENGPIAIDDPKNYDARANLMWAGTVALNGWIGAGVKGDWASHMIAHELSARYDLAHGAALAIVFPSWMKKVYKTNLSRFRQFAEMVWEIDGAGKSDEKIAAEGIEAVIDFYKNRLRVGVKLFDYEIGVDAIDKMAESANGSSGLGSFVQLTKKDIEDIYRNAL